MNTTADTQERGETHTSWGGATKWLRSIISRTRLYNWSLIDMKRAGLAQAVLNTCRQPRAGNAGGLFAISVPSSD